MARIALNDVHKRFGSVEVLRDLDVADGEFVMLVGPSGCGKSTLPRMIAELEPISSGDLTIGGWRMNDASPRDRDVAMVSQSYALYRHMDVAKNLGFSMEIRGPGAEWRRSRAAKAKDTLGLSALTKRLPRALSGGQRQRVAMGRAIVHDPLDAALRVGMRLEIARLHQSLGATMVYVTHDQVEALTLADRIIVLSGGHVQQIGTPLDVYERPANKFVAQFIGSPTMNVVPVRSGPNDVATADSALIPVRAAVGKPAEIKIRPGHVDVVEPDGSHLRAVAQVIERLSSDTNIDARVEGLDPLLVPELGNLTVRTAERVGLRIRPERAHLFDAAGNALGRAGA